MMSFTRLISIPSGSRSLSSSSTPYAPRISSPLATCPPLSYSTVACVSSSPHSDRLSSPPFDGCTPLSLLPESDSAAEDTEMQTDDTFSQPSGPHLDQPLVVNLDSTTSSGLGPCCLPLLAPSRLSGSRVTPARPFSSPQLGTSHALHRSAGFKQRPSNSWRHSSSSADRVDSHLRSARRLSKARSKPGSTPAQLRQQAANQIRAHHRNEIISSRRALISVIDELFVGEEESTAGSMQRPSPTQVNDPHIYQTHQLYQADVSMYH